MLDCHIQLVAGEGWQSARRVSSPRNIQHELMGAGFGQATLADHHASACLPCSAGAEMRRGYMFFGSDQANPQETTAPDRSLKSLLSVPGLCKVQVAPFSMRACEFCFVLVK